MKNISPLNFVHKVGKFGEHAKKSENNLLKVSEINGLLYFRSHNIKILVSKFQQLNLTA